MAKKQFSSSLILVFALSASVAAVALQARSQAPRKTSNSSAVSVFTEAYPYAGKQFDRFVAESYDYCGSKNWRSFYSNMDQAYRKYRSRFSGWKSANLSDMLSSQNSRLNAIMNTSKRAQAELVLSANLHRFIKTAIPNFSLDRGYEFYYVQKRGERQCFLQSVLIAGMLQKAGVNAGVVMVYKNTNGDQSNNGHAVDLVRLSDGRDIIVDASEHQPFAKQRGIFVRKSSYAYVDPVFAAHSSKIVRYKSASDGKTIERTNINALDNDFLRSQFWYYRGERTPGGLLLQPKTPRGLAKSEQALRTSVSICPNNPLAVFTLGRVYISEGKMMQAKETIVGVNVLYNRFGWVPVDMKNYVTLVTRPGIARSGP